MPDVTLSSGLVQPAISSTAWGPKQHANLALIDPLFARVAALQAMVPTEYLSLGTTFPQIQEAVLDMPAGSRIYLPGETVEQSVTGTSVLQLDKELEIFGHPNGLSELLLNANVTSGYGGGTSHQIQIGKDSATVIPRMWLSGFKVRHNRVASPDMRCVAFDLGFRCNNLRIDNITFAGLTSDFFIGRPYPPVQWGCENLDIHDCHGVGCWEGWFNWHGGWGKNIRISRCGMSESTIHVTYQGPMGLELNIEQTTGGIDGFYADDCHFTVTGAASGVGGNSGSLGYVHGNNYPKGNSYFTNIHASNCSFNGFFFGAYFPMLNYSEGKLPAQKTVTVLTKCDFPNSHSAPLYVWPDSSEKASARIVSNRCVTNGTTAEEAWDTEYAHDQEGYCKITNPLAGTAIQIGLQDKNNSLSPQYQIFFSNATTLQVWARWDSTGTGLDWLQVGADITVAPAADDEWKFRRVGSTLTIYKNGALIATRTDSGVSGPGYLGFLIPGGTSIKDFGGGAVGSSALLDSFTRANEDPLNPANWIANGGWRTASANDRLILVDCTGNANNKLIDQSRLTTSGPAEIIESPNPNDWT